MLQIKNTLGGGKPEGLYAWKKYGCIPEQTIVNPTFHIKANVSTQKATITSDDINFKAFGTLTDKNNFYQSREPEFCNFMNGFMNSNSSVNFAISTSTYSGQLELNYSNNSYWNAFTKMTPTDTGAELTASNLFKTTIDDTLQYTGTKTIATKIGEFISYIVSDKETAYPDGGELNGYWYERVRVIDLVKIGCTKFEEGSVVLSSDSDSMSLNHSLDVVPKFGLLYTDELPNSGVYVKNMSRVIRPSDGYDGYALFYGNALDGEYKYNYQGSGYTWTTTTAYFSCGSSQKFKSGITYNYVIFG